MRGPLTLLIAVLVAPPVYAIDVLVDPSAAGYPISPDIYGINFGDSAQLARMGVTVRRWGGNGTTRYNWQNSTTNHANDWFFENIRDAPPNGFSNTADAFISETLAAGVQPLVTLPALGWVCKDSAAQHPYDCSFKVSRYGAQQATDPYDADCGNGVSPGGAPLTGNVPADTSIAITEAWATDWQAHLQAQFGSAAQGGVRLFAIDNEPSLWSSTHRDVHPALTSYTELRDKLFAYGRAVKDADPAALILGPIEWGWLPAFNLGNSADETTYGAFYPWYLDQARLYEVTNGVRLLDYLDIHYYPQGTGVALSSDTSPTTNALRLRSTRGLWDATYTDESWQSCCYGGVVKLIPLLRDWVAQHYPGTRLAVTEYNWGAVDDVVGALAEADVLGIFGRERLDLATLWAGPASGSIGEDAFRLYRDYDGAGARFADLSIPAASSSADELTAYAAKDANGRVTVVLVNKRSDAALPAHLVLNGEARGAYRSFAFGSLGRLAAAASGSATDGVIDLSVAAYTAQLIEWTPEQMPGDHPLTDVVVSTNCGCVGAEPSLGLLGALWLLRLVRRRLPARR